MSTVLGLNVKWNYLSKESQLKSFSSGVLRDGIVRNLNSEFSDKSSCFILIKSSKMFLSSMYKGSVTLLPFSRSEILSSPLMVLFKICFIALYERSKCVNIRGHASLWNCVSLFKNMLILVMFGLKCGELLRPRLEQSARSVHCIITADVMVCLCTLTVMSIHKYCKQQSGSNTYLQKYMIIVITNSHSTFWHQIVLIINVFIVFAYNILVDI